MCPADEVEVNPFEIHVVEDPLQGRAVHAHWIERAALPRRPDATAVQNWDYYDGAIVGVGIRTPNRLRIYGSGVMIAPGVVLTASHTLNDHREAVSARTQEIQCLAIRRDGRVELWTAERWRWPEANGDISVLSVRLRTEVPAGWSCACLPITTRAPRDDETLSVVGFQFGAPNRNGRIGTIGDIPIIGHGAMYVSTGAVRKLWYRSETRCGSHFRRSRSPATRSEE